MADDIFSQLDMANQVTSAAQAAGVRPELAHALVRQESRGQQGALSPKGALGLMQVMPQTAARPGFGVEPFDPKDPKQNLSGGMNYLGALLKHFNGDEAKALAAYNGGVGAVESGRAQSFPETQNYVKSIQDRGGAQSALGTSAPPSEPDIFAQLDAVKQPEGKTFGGFIDKIPGSAANLASGVGHAIAHPFDTLQNTAKIVAGGIENLAPGLVAETRKLGAGLPQDQTDSSPKPKQFADAVGDFYKKRYGGAQQIGDTLYNDPVGAAADAAGLFTGVGGAAKLGGLTRVGGALARAGEMLDPIQAASKVVSSIVQNPAERLAQHVTNVNMQIPKALRRRELNSPFTPAEAVLNEGRGTNPFTRFSQGGLDNAQANGGKLTTLFDQLLANDKPNKYPLDSIQQILEDQKTLLGHDINAQPKQAQVQSIIDNLNRNPNYSRDKFGTVMVPKVTPGTPASTILDANGQPLRAATAATTTMVPTQQVIGRELIPQTAQELNVIKGNVDKGLTFGERGGTLEEAQKAARRGIDSIIDQNVPGADLVNQRRAQNVVASKALQDAILARQTKRAGGLAEALLFAAPILGAEGHPIAGAMAGLPWLYNTIVKHPTLSSPIAAGAHAVGTFTTPAAVTSALRAAVPASRLNEASQNAFQLRPVTKTEATDAYEQYLKRAQAGQTGQP